MNEIVPADDLPQSLTGQVVPQDDLPSVKPEKQAVPETPEGFIAGVKETLSNIPSSAGNLVKNIGQAISHPLDTGKGVIDIGAGALQAAFAPEAFKKSGNPGLYSPEAEKAFNSAVDFYKKRYGGWNNFLETVKKDPVGVALDASIVSGALSKTARLAGLTRTAETLGKVSKAIDPIRQAGKVVKGVARPVYQYAAGLTTGAGAEAIKQALKGGDAFTQAMRGKISETDVLDTAKGALQSIKDERGAAYRSQLAELSKKSNNIDISSIKSSADHWLGKYGITKTPQGLDFSRSTLRNNPAAANEVKAVYETVQEWGSRAHDTTPSGLDTLKRVISDSYTSQNPSRAMVTDLASKVKTKIVREVPEYAKMTEDYAKASDIIDDMNRGLSLSDKAATDTALRKLMTSMREDKTFRRSLIAKLDSQAGTDVAGAVSGLLLKNPWSNRLGSMGHVYGTGMAAAYMHNPALLGMLPLGSPRFVGELSKAIGQTGSVLGDTSPLYQGAYVGSSKDQ